MRLVYLKQALADLRWFRRYYVSLFPVGASRANSQFQASHKTLRDNPLTGHRVEGTPLREYPIVRTPFVIVYRIRDDAIEVVRIWDCRGDPLDR